MDASPGGSNHVGIHPRPRRSIVESHWAIENLIATYAELVDDGDFAGLGTLLADATFIGMARR